MSVDAASWHKQEKLNLTLSLAFFANDKALERM